MGTGIFGLFLSTMSIGQEGKALRRIFASPVDPESCFKANAILPLSLSLILALGYSVIFSLVFHFGLNATTSLLVLSIAMACISVSIGLYFGSRYPELGEKPRGSYITGTGIPLSMLVLWLAGIISASPILIHIPGRWLRAVSVAGRLLGIRKGHFVDLLQTLEKAFSENIRRDP